MKQGTLTLPEHLVPHPLQGALYCIGCSLAGFRYFTHVVCLTIYGIEYRYWICLLVLLFIIRYDVCNRNFISIDEDLMSSIKFIKSRN